MDYIILFQKKDFNHTFFDDPIFLPILNKIDYLEEIIKAGAGTNNFDIDAYKSLVEKDVNDKLKKVEALIMPLLANLLKNPDKDFIKWPNRKPIIEAQISKILAITRPPEG
jgi:hypothetical protein